MMEKTIRLALRLEENEYFNVISRSIRIRMLIRPRGVMIHGMSLFFH